MTIGRVPPTLLLTAALLGCSIAYESPPRPGAGTRPDAEPLSASRRLQMLFEQADETNMKLDPLYAVYRGEKRFPDLLTRFGDALTDAHVEATRAARKAQLAALHRIDRNALAPEEQVAYDAFKWTVEQSIHALEPRFVALTITRPLAQVDGQHMLMADFSSGNGAPFETVEDYENNLKRLDDFIHYLERAEMRMREGMRSGIVQPRILMEKVVKQFDDLLDPGIEASPYYRPITRFPDHIPAAEQARLTRDYQLFLRTKLFPAHRRLRDFIQNDYLPRTRTSVGLSSLPGGAALYDMLIEKFTTLPMTAAEIHALGLAEVARINMEMAKVKEEVGFTGSLQEFASYMRNNPKFKPQSAEQMRERYLDIKRRVGMRIGSLFSTLPKAPLDVRMVEPYRQRSAPNASYSDPAPDGSRPGIFYFNTSALESRITYDAETLFLHEGIPGHHFQVALALENKKLPQFLRDGGTVAFGEGWALYAESLGPELGLFQDPYQRYGFLVNQMFRAARLVVDTGIHARGWTRERAIRYMLDTTAYGEPMLVGEVDRYIARPGQALAYKIGERAIERLRSEAEQALGQKFDIREFHEQVLMTGGLPLPVLEAKIRRWIAVAKAR